MLKEWFARGLVTLGLVIAISVPAMGWWRNSQGVVMHARMAETGGWTPESLTVAVGEPLHLKLTSDDVTHGFAIGQSDQPAVDVKPGEMTDVTLVFNKPGKYTFYCTRWCSVNHWRMRGTIEVTDSNGKIETAKSPLYVTLGLDIDAVHQSPIIPTQMPSARHGAILSQNLPSEYKNLQYYLTHTPVDLFMELRSETILEKLTDQDIWDLAAWVWQSNTTPYELQLGKELFAANCAACHGENGAGNGVFADQLTASSGLQNPGQTMGEQIQPPADFTDLSRMLSASPAHLQGKIIRGGMGTGMPYWGPIFTEDQTWVLVAYLWTFQFNWR
jgi:mono/diheme cytochrome c family protein/plastocyanin